MTTELGGVTLDYDPIWANKHRLKDYNLRMFRAVDSTLIFVESEKGTDFPMTLTGSKRTGWLKGSTVDDLRALSAAGGTHTLTLNSVNYTVKFDNSKIPVDMTYMHDDGVSAPDDDTWYYGTINLICTGV